ncbi:carboxypeptidase-like regulatory domain-containing protein [Teredinibacter haidensis]|uniref:carboxypeptidase-like regulatory domain-containing protein n=1 Tax=Teredinibacter haidensis TaxID=2731755 RepID=UPI000948F448|nr:carboxypeptidase-like regulatory domain-containing protein [Teredinibacter haidensis]
MELKEFTAKEVAPGEPITAQAWNELVGGIRSLNEFVAASQKTSLEVTLGNVDIDLSKVRVTAERDDGWLVEAAVNSEDVFVFTSLPAGAFIVTASAPGFSAATQNITVPTESSVQLTMAQSGAFMPNVTGVELGTALNQLSELGIAVGRLIDVVGRELAPAKPDSEYLRQPLLVQLPDPGVPVLPSDKISLVVSTALQVDDSVEIPPLTGLTLAEARKTLESLGLRLGDVETRQKGV